jgi:hypothetical protein
VKLLTTLATYTLAFGGLFVMLGFFGMAVAHNTSYLNARLLFLNLLRQNPNQAEAVASTQPHSFYEAIAMTMKTVAQMGASDLENIQKASRPTWEAGCTMVQTWWKTTMTKAKLAAGAAGAGVAIPASSGEFPPIPVLICGILAGAAFLYLMYRQADTDRSLIRARAEVLPEIERVFVEGRYMLPQMG